MNIVAKSTTVTVTSAIKFLSGSLAGSVFPLAKPEITIGSDVHNDIVIQDDSSVASYHARLLWSNSSWMIQKHPLASILTVNSQAAQQARLDSKATVGLGENTFLLLVGREAALELDLHTHNNMAADHPLQEPTRRASQADATSIAPLSTIGIPSLMVSGKAGRDQRSYLLDKPVISIGRDPSNDIVVDEPIVSAFHAQIVRQHNRLILVHPHPVRQHTLNGLLYQGRKVRGDEHFTKELVAGDIFRIGDEDGMFVTLTYDDGSETKQNALPSMRPVKLTGATVSIGCAPDNTLVLSHPQVSAHHARLQPEGGTYRLLDLGSTNHVYVNGQLVTNHLLRMHDEIRLGPYRLLYEGTQLAEYDESRYIRVDALNLKKVASNGVTLLNNISLSIPPRAFVAIVGGSGAGKSTLMGALSGGQPAQEGKVLYNGQNYYENMAAFSNQIGYVPQDDIVHQDLTVGRALYYAARMRLPKDFTREQIEQRLSEVLEDVELTAKRNQLIKHLSGGQRKRVSIALELLANPSLFFLDEPTSGLDPSLDRKMMYLLRKLADKGHTIILVTHATNNLSACDYVCFLAPGGRLAFFGPPDGARTYFEKEDFADMYGCLEVSEAKPGIPEEAEARFKVSPEYYKYIAGPPADAPASTPESTSATGTEQKAGKASQRKRRHSWQQFVLLCQRRVELLKNNRRNLAILLLQAPLVALLLMLLVRSEIGTGIFDADKLVQCRPQILTQSGLLSVPGVANPNALIDCGRVETFLNFNAAGKAYARERGDSSHALQDFIVPSIDGGDAQRVIFLVSFFAVMFGVINASREIVKELAIYRRERAVNLGILPYLLSKIAVLGTLALLQGVAILFIANAFEPFAQGVFLPVLLEVYVPLTLSALAGVMLGLSISALVPDEDSVSSMLPLVIIVQVILAGAIIPLKDWFTMLLAAIAPTRWAAIALGSSIGLHSDKIDGGYLFGSDPVYHGTLYSIYSQPDATQRLLLAWGALLVIVLVLGCAVGLLLKRKDGRR